METRSYFGSFLYQLTPFINTVLSATYSENSPTGTGNTNNNSTQKTLTYGAGVNWQILRWLTATPAVHVHEADRQRRLRSGPSSGTADFAENRATLSLFATF